MTIKAKSTTVTISRQMYERAWDWAQSRRLDVAQVIEEAIEEAVPRIAVPETNGGAYHRPISAEEIQDMPERRPMSYEEYLKFAPDWQKVEWVNGEAIIYMPASDKHQDLLGFLYSLVRAFTTIFKLGLARQSPFEVKLWPDGPSREPDLLFLATGNPAKQETNRIVGAPDLAVEIISPGSTRIDRVDKHREYEQAKVKEYWLIDPRPRQKRAIFYVLDEEGFYLPLLPDAQGIYHSTVIPHFWLKADWLWQNPLPSQEMALAEIMVTVPGLDDELKEIYQSLYQALKKRQ
jgi:Uma2 family endonuclease